MDGVVAGREGASGAVAQGGRIKGVTKLSAK